MAWWASKRAAVRLLLPLVVVWLGLLVGAPATVAKSGPLMPARAERLNSAPPAASGAEAAYPLNHTFDGGVSTAGTPPPNHDFEAPGAGTAVGIPAPNHTFSTPARSVGTPPINADFEAATDFSGWTVTGTPTIQTDTAHGRHAKLAVGTVITSSAFTVDAAAQALVLDLGYVAPSGLSGVKVYALTGADYTTQTEIESHSCSSTCAGTWTARSADATPYRGQSVKLKFERYLGDVAIDAVRMLVHFPEFEAEGKASRATETDGSAYARLDGNGSITSSAFIVNSAAQSITVRLRGLSTGSDQYYIYVLSGAGFATSTREVIESGASDSWHVVRIAAAPYIGQPIKLKVTRQNGSVGVDDVGLQQIDVPSWSVTKDTRLETGGPSGVHASTNGTLTSQSFTIGVDVQQVSAAYKGTSGSSVLFVELLHGSDFSQVQDLAGSTTASETHWNTLKVGVGAYAGQTVKLRIRQGSGRVLIDDVGIGEKVVSGWQPIGTGAVAVDNDPYGTFVTPAARGNIELRSTLIQTGIIDRSNKADKQYVAVSYDIGERSGSYVRVDWIDASGKNWSVFQDATNTPTGYRTRYFPLLDSFGSKGYFEIKVYGGKLYSIADNIGRQQVAEQFSHKVGRGVDTSTGAFGLTEQDLQAVGALPLTLTRFYNGHSDRVGSLGYRWSHSLETRLEVSGDGDAGVIFGDGREAFFDWNSFSGRFTPADARVKDKLTKNGDGTHIFTTTNNLTYHFNSAGVLTSIADLNGNAITLAYDGTGRLTLATGPGGTALAFAYSTGGRLATVTDPVGAVVTYTYDAAGDLTSMRDPEGGVRSYTYNKHRLIKVVDKNSQTLFVNTLDATNRVTAQADAENKSITITYDTPAKGATRVTDPTGKAATYYFDIYHRTTDKEDPSGGVVSYLYDGEGNLQKVVDRAANGWQFTYDGDGNLTRSADPLNNALQITYNPLKLPASVTDARGNVTRLEYDAKGNLTRKTDPLNNATTYTYDARGNILSTTNALNQTETFTHDAANNRTSRTDVLGNTWRWTYDAAGRMRTETDPLGNTTSTHYDLAGRVIRTSNALNQQTTYVYDAGGRLSIQDDPLGGQTRWEYDNRGLAASKTDPAGKVTTYAYDAKRRMTAMTDQLGRVTRYAYDENDQLVNTTDPTGAVTTYTYNSAGRVASVKDPLNRTTSYTYDSAGRVTRTTAPNGGVTVHAHDADGNVTSVTDALNRTTTFTHNALGQLTRVTDPLSGTTQHTYDAAGRRIGVTDALGKTTSYAYDATGRLAGITNPLNQMTTMTYDAAGRRMGMTDPLNRTTSYAYDAAGRTTNVTQPGNATTTTTYDAAGRMTQVRQPSGATTSYAYDPRGLLLTVTDPLNHVTRYAYDGAGQQTSMTDPLGRVTSYQYDGAGRETRVTDALNGAVQFSYDAAGQQTAVTNPRGKAMRFTYDALGNVLTETDPLNRTTTNAYDAVGRLTRTTDPRGIAIDYSYDAGDRLAAMAYPGGSVTQSYDALGRRTGMTDATGTTSWTYDAAGQTLSLAAPGGTVAYTYDAAGERASMTLPGNRTVSYAYDSTGRLASLSDWQNRAVSFGYDAAGQRTSITRPGNVSTAYAYDAAGRTTSVTHTGPAGQLQRFGYMVDGAGNRTAMTSSAGTETYTLDALNRLTAVTYAGGETATYTYDANGNRLTKAAGGTTTAYTYDDGDQLLTEGTTTYTHDAAGNMTARGGDTFTWDWANRLTGAAAGDATATYTYDGDGVRVRKSVGGAGTTYLWDRESGLPLLVDDGSFGYLHADGVQGQVGNTGAPRYELDDALGSVRGQTNADGSPAGSAEYDVFGGVRGTPSLTGSFGFTGEQRDAETGFTFLRSRYLDPGLGRLLSADTVQPNAPGTQGYNRYAYVANNPTSWVDPSGHSAEAATVVLASRFMVTVPYAVLLSPAGAGVMTALVIFACLQIDRCNEALTNAWARLEAGGLTGLGGAIQMPFLKLACILNSRCMRFVGSTETVERGIQIPLPLPLPGEQPEQAAPRPGPGPQPGPQPLPMPPVPPSPGGEQEDEERNCWERTLPGIPRIDFSRTRFDAVAQHMLYAQTVKGKPRVLTIDRPGRRVRSRQATPGIPLPLGMDRDEYPPAMFAEGGAGASVVYVTRRSNRSAGQYLGSATGKYPDGTRVEICVTP